MDHLDFDGMLSTTSATWMLPAFDQQDAVYLSSSRQMLEPIMEETSEDEENQNWSQYESTWSSESDTGSVIRIEVQNEQDTVSERDFACPAKRPRRSDDTLVYEESTPCQIQQQQQFQHVQPQLLNSPQTRKFYRNENVFSANDVSDNYRKRFDEFCSDSDSLSYNSLSRSSSLIQFESLEKQFQNDTSLGNSSPSLLSFIENEELAKQGSDTNLKRFESSEGRLHQTYYNLDKIDFTNTLMFCDNDQNHNYQTKSDSESSDNSILSHEERIPKTSVNLLTSNEQRISHKTGKSSAENLSEDSGYGEYSSGLRVKSKSIPNFLRTNDKFCEEDEFEGRRSLEMICSQENSMNTHDRDEAQQRSRPDSKDCKRIHFPRESCTIKLDRDNECMLRKSSPLPLNLTGNSHQPQQQQHQTSIRASSCTERDKSYQAPRRFYNNVEDADSVGNDHDSNSYTFSDEDNDRSKYYCNKVKNSYSSNKYSTLPASSSHISSSLPDVRIQYNHEFDDGNNCSDSPSCDFRSVRSQSSFRSSFYNNYHNEEEQYTIVSSLPENINLFGLSSTTSESDLNCTVKQNDRSIRRNISQSSGGYDQTDDCEWNSRSLTLSARSENRLEDKYFGFLANFSGGKASSQKVQSSNLNYMNASYNNLTLLDYSGKSNSYTMSDYTSGGNSKRNSREFDLGKGNFLLDELSSHFDRNLSIMSDRARDSDIVSDFINNEKYNHNKNEKPPEDVQQTVKRSKVPPKPPIRRSSMKKEPSGTQSDIEMEIQAIQPSIQKTFDLDPTNLKTNYAESLEKCNFDPREISTTDLTAILANQNEQLRKTSVPIKRGFVASTPNLNTFRSNPDELNVLDDEMHVSSAHTSMNQLPGEKKLGILLPSGSRNSLGKGVSFCPIVSEISWRDQSSDECMEPDSLENVPRDDHLASSEDDSEYAPSDDDDDDGGFKERQRHPHQFVTVAITTTTFGNINLGNSPIDNSNTCNQIQVKAEITNSNTSLNASNSNENHNTPIDQQKHRQPQVKHDKHEGGVVAKVEDRPAPDSLRIASMKTNRNTTDSNASIVAQCRSRDNVDYGNEPKFAVGNANARLVTDTSRPVNKLKVRDSAITQDRCDVVILEKRDSVISDRENDRNSNKPIVKTIRNVESVSKSKKKSVIKDNTNEDIIQTANMPNSRSTGTNTGTDLLKQKFMVKPEEKHKNSFLSRFTGGFRFSLRRKKKPQPLQGSVSGDSDRSSGDEYMRNLNNKKGTNGKNIDSIVHIPLKNPKAGQWELVNKQNQYPSVSPVSSNTSREVSSPYGNNIDTNGGHLVDFPSSYIDNSNHILLGKPPLPKQPPRVVGVCEKIRACQNASSGYTSSVSSGSSCGGFDVPNSPYDKHAHHIQQYNIHKPREIDERFLDNERDFYKNQFDGTMNGSGSSNSNILPPPPSFAETTDHNRPLYTTQTSDTVTVTKINGDVVNQNAKHKIGLIETNLDTHETIITGKTRSLMELGPQVRLQLHKQNPGTCHQHDAHVDDGASRRPHKSMEFLLDKENQKNVLPPENELQKTHDSTAALSEHQLRVQASLQRLNIPDWFRQYTPKPTTESGYKPGAFTRKRASDSGRWAGLNSKTTSLSSLGSQRSDRSPLMLSPSAHSHHGGQIGFSRWSTSHLNSNQTSPSISTRGSFSRGGVANSSFMSGHSVGSSSIRGSFRQPYLGWRSQEKLSQPRTPHERLASSLLAQQQSQKPEPAVTPEIQSSIKEVTSAIVHYVNDQTNRTSRSRSTSPSSRRCWLESSFVGIRPLESPQTPVIDNSFNTTVTSSTNSGIVNDGGLRMNGVVAPLERSSAASASLEDVLASLLGLPTDTYRSTGDSVNETGMRGITTETSASSLQVEQQNRFRRRSEGDAQRQQAEQQNQNTQKLQNPQQNEQPQTKLSQNNASELSLPSQASRRVSLDSSESKTTSEMFVKCRNTKCDQSATPVDAKKYYKSCHNCSHLYCSRECRRTHWEKHRKACLHSRVSNLCRQVLSSCKDDIDTLRHLSLLARKGYLSQGRGVVRILFRSPENAEGFIKNGFQCLGEASYVRWPDLMPAEMGLELYSELLRLSTEYKPDSKMLIYVAICVVSEAPGSGTAPVKWERQLVSRCAKLKLCKAILAELDQTHQYVIVKEPSTDILILTFNPQKRTTQQQRELILTNIQLILSKRGVVLRKHYPEVYQRLQTFVEGQTDRFLPVTMHPRDSTTGQGFVCIIMPNPGEGELIRSLPTSDTGNRVTSIDVGEEILES